MAQDLSQFPLHLGLGATVVSQPEFTNPMAWYQSYAERNAADGVEGRLVSLHTFDTSWDTWEMHPLGHEAVIVTQGSMELVQQGKDEEDVYIPITAGQVAINPPGVWHTANVEPGTTCTALFITAGKDTQMKDRVGEPPKKKQQTTVTTTEEVG